MAPAVESVRVRVLGGFSVEGVADHDLASRKGRLLLKVLVLARGQAVPADRLAEIVWAERLPGSPVEQIGVLVSRLRTVLGAARLPRTDGGYSFRCDWLDADELARRVAEATDALAAGRLGAARAAAQSAEALARGALLPEEDGDWVEADRAACEVLRSAARRVAAQAAGLAGDHVSAASLAQLVLIDDPLDEASLRVLMRAQVASGRPGSALAAYARLRERLAEELGVSPTAETEALHHAIVLDEPGVVPVEVAAEPVRLIGRERELAALDAALQRARSGGTELAVVEGEPGIGKSALVEHWSERVTGTLVLLGRCDQIGWDLPLGPIADAVSARLRGLPLDEVAALFGADEVLLGPLLGFGAKRPPNGATVIADADIGRGRLFTALVGLVHRLADGRPLVLVVDDAHLAGPSTLGWISFAVRRLGSTLVIATAPSHLDLPFANATLVPVGALDAAATELVVGHVRGRQLHEASGGNPLLLLALADLASTPEHTAPSTVRDAVERRLRTLGAESGATLRASAVLGSIVDLDLLADVVQQPASTLLDHLEAGVSRGLLVERGAGFEFRHEIERVALADAAGSARRALLHREAARALARRVHPDPLEVAGHARLGGDLALASTWYVAAAEVSVNRFDVVAAEAHLMAALDAEPSASVHIARARLHMATLRLAEAETDITTALSMGAGASALEVAGWVAYYRRRYDAALAYADEGGARADDVAVRVSCLALGGRVRHGSGDLPGAVEQLELARSLDAPPQVRGLASVWLAQARLHQGRPREALALLHRPLVEPERLAHPFAGLHGRFVRSLALGYLGQIPELLASCDDLDLALERAGEVGRGLVGPAANTRAWALRWCGRLAEADELNERAIEHTDPTGARAEAHYAGLLDLADGCLLRDDPAGAEQMSRRLTGIETWEGTMAWHQRHRWNLLRARLALADGDRDRAAAFATQVHADAVARGATRYELLAAGVLALATGPSGSGDEQVAEVVVGLGRCAVMDGWPLVDALGRAFGVDAWRVDAASKAAAMISSAPRPADATRFVDRVLG